MSTMGNKHDQFPKQRHARSIAPYLISPAVLPPGCFDKVRKS